MCRGKLIKVTIGLRESMKVGDTICVFWWAKEQKIAMWFETFSRQLQGYTHQNGQVEIERS
jgi:hypothetical protein